MDRAAIVTALNQVQQALQAQKVELEKILSTPVWDQTIYDELDKTVELSREIAKIANDLVEIQRKVLTNPKQA